jgi:choloylglycine hydrolase
MWLRPTQYPAPDARPQLSELQWIQYQLDNFSTVKDVIASDKTVRIDVVNSSPLHFLVCDRKGEAAAVEFLDGKMVVHTGKNLPSTALTNSTYHQSEGLLRQLEGEKKGREQSDAFNAANYSLKRFIWAGEGARSWNPKKNISPVDYAFKVLEKVTVTRTMFSIVYDVKNRLIYFRTKSNPGIRFFSFAKFDFSCKTPAKILDMAGSREGDVTAFFKDYTFDANYDLIQKSFSGTSFLMGVPEEVRRARAKYPQTLPCSPSMQGTKD